MNFHQTHTCTWLPPRSGNGTFQKLPSWLPKSHPTHFFPQLTPLLASINLYNFYLSLNFRCMKWQIYPIVPGCFCSPFCVVNSPVLSCVAVVNSACCHRAPHCVTVPTTSSSTLLWVDICLWPTLGIMNTVLLGALPCATLHEGVFLLDVCLGVELLHHKPFHLE